MDSKKFIISSFFILLLISPSVLGFFPISHKYIFEESLKYEVDSNIKKSIEKYPDLAYAGSELVDVSVMYYFTRFELYTITHSPSFCRKLLENANNEQEIACASSCGIHQSADIVSHTEMVHYAIRHTFLVNSISHVFAEQKMDNILEKDNPGLRAEVIASMNSYQTCIPLFKRTLQGEEKYNGVDLDSLFSKFVAEIQGSSTGYDPSFNNLFAIPLVILVIYVAVTLFFLVLLIVLLFKRNKTIFNYISIAIALIIFGLLLALFIANIGGKSFVTFQAYIRPISNLVPIGDSSYYTQKAISNTVNFYKYGESTLFGTDSSGSEELAKADSEVLVYDYIILALILIGLTLFIYLNFKGTKRKNKLNL